MAKKGAVAFDVYYWPDGGYDEGVTVKVNTTGTIDGRIEYTNDGSDLANVAKKAKLNIQNGNFTGTFTIQKGAEDTTGIIVYGGSFTNPSPCLL